MNQIINKLKEKLPPNRFKHSLGVSETAVMLARKYGADPDKARIAGLLHDCARGMTPDDLLQRAETFGIVITDVDRREPVLLHAPVGAFIAKLDYGITDADVLMAITRHTTGGSGMSLLDDMIFLADFIEPGRSFSGVEKLRELAKKDLQEALLAAYDQTLFFLLNRRGLIHLSTVEGRNFLLSNRK